MSQETIIFSMERVSKTVPPQKTILKNIYLSFFYGAKIGVLGLNGAGKSSLLRVIAGIDKSYTGDVVFSPGYTVGMLEQEPKLDPTKTVKEIVEEGVAEIVGLLKEFDEINELDLGDWVGVTGLVMTTRKGELSIKVEHAQLLSKAVRPLPDKWHGLTDVDTRYRQRYADLIINEEARRTFEIRHATIASFRKTLHDNKFIEVETPVLHMEAGGAHARPFLTHHNTLDMQLFLRIALELHLKRLIVGGMERVFEIGRVFRNEGISTRHNPEFTMMESYQAFGDYTEVMALTEELITNASRDARGTTTVVIQGNDFDLAQPWRKARMIDLASDATGVTLHPSMDVAAVREVAAKHKIKCEKHWGSGRVIEEIFAELCEKDLITPTFVTHHPVEISPLARQDRNDPHLTERFELFIGGREIANGYSELNDPIEQRKRFEDEQLAKEAGDNEAGSLDEDYLRALEFGMPPTAGLGIGIDRLVMLLSDAGSIKDVILFPTLRPEAK